MASQLQPHEHHTTRVLSAPDGPGQPGLVAQFEPFRFQRPQIPVEWQGLDLADEELLTVLGAP
ncbi:MAG: hypothetical protein AB2A00_09095 [Myxococcota bacterium]